MGAGNAIDHDIEIDRALDLDDMVDHVAKFAAVADVVEAVAIGAAIKLGSAFLYLVGAGPASKGSGPGRRP